MGINWKVRLRTKAFWLAFVPAVLLFAQVLAAPFGYRWDFAVLNEQMAAIINAVFSLLALLGVVADPTTAGLADSAQALAYEKPKEGE